METGPDVSPEAKAAADAADPDVQAWEAMTGGLQKNVPWAAPGEKWTSAACIFDLAEQG